MKNKIHKVHTSEVIELMFRVERGSESIFTKNDLILKSNIGHYLMLSTVQNQLASDFFKENNPHLIKIWEKAKAMMKAGRTGIVVPNEFSHN